MPVFSAAVSTDSNSLAAVRGACEEAASQLGSPPSLAVLFFSQNHVDEADSLAAEAVRLLGTNSVVGCNSETVLGNASEYEGQSALVVWLADLSGEELSIFELEYEHAPDGGSFLGWPDEIPRQADDAATLIVLGDPFTFPADLLLAQTNAGAPRRRAFGGMAGGSQVGSNRVVVGDRVKDAGAVVVHLPPAIAIRSIVSQGCRPIGRPFVITASERNTVSQLGGVSAYQRLEEVFRELPTRDQEMVQRGLHLGRVINEYQDDFEQGDFLVRNVIGADPESGTLTLADFVRPGQTVQFHVRDAETADAELKQLIARLKQEEAFEPLGGLLFTCNGRGQMLFSEPHHDAATLHDSFGQLPLAGFFAAGEIGPIGGANFLHGFTASAALFGR